MELSLVLGATGVGIGLASLTGNYALLMAALPPEARRLAELRPRLPIRFEKYLAGIGLVGTLLSMTLPIAGLHLAIDSEEQFRKRQQVVEQTLEQTIQLFQRETAAAGAQPMYDIPAADVSGKLQPVSQTNLVWRTLSSVSYPEPLDVNPECVTKAAAQKYNDRSVGLAPILVDDRLHGFLMWANKVGAGYQGMGNNALNVGRACEQTEDLRYP